MSILGVIVRAQAPKVVALREQLAHVAGVEVALDPGDGRLILVIEDAPGQTAAASLARIAQWPEVLNTSLVYEHSDPDLPDNEPAVADFNAWRGSPLPQDPERSAGAQTENP